MDRHKVKTGQVVAMTPFNFTRPAELYPALRLRAGGGGMTYKRFASASEAIRYAVEDLKPELLYGTVMEIDEERFDGRQIQELYVSDDYPLKRNSKLPKKSDS